MFIGTPCILKVHFLESSQKQSLMFENQKINANSNQGRLQGGLMGVGLVKYIFLRGFKPPITTGAHYPKIPVYAPG